MTTHLAVKGYETLKNTVANATGAQGTDDLSFQVKAAHAIRLGHQDDDEGVRVASDCDTASAGCTLVWT